MFVPPVVFLQHIVQDAFFGFEACTIVIFDNFLIMADNFEDAYQTLEKVLNRCTEYNIVLKMKKSRIGVEAVTSFGYAVKHNQWKLSDTRKQAINEMAFSLSWVPHFSSTTTFRLFRMNRQALRHDAWWLLLGSEQVDLWLSQELSRFQSRFVFPLTTLCRGWYDAVGSILWRNFRFHQPIAFASKRFSGFDSNLDTFKREAYIIYYQRVYRMILPYLTANQQLKYV